MHMSGEHFGSISRLKLWCPASLQTFDTLWVPLQMSQMSMCFVFLAVQCYSSPWPHEHSRACVAHLSSRTRFRFLLDNNRLSRPQTCPLPAGVEPRGQRASLPVRQQQLPWVVFIKMGLVASRIAESISELCCAPASRVAVLEERVSDLEASQRYSQSPGLSVCCVGHDKLSKAYR